YKNKGKKDGISTSLVLLINDIPIDTFDLGTIARGGEGVITYNYQAPPERGKTIKAQLEIKAINNPIYRSNILVNKTGSPSSLSLEIKPQISKATLGDEIGYNITYKNNGDFPATSLIIQASKDEFTTYIPNSTYLNQAPILDINGQSSIFSGISLAKLNGLSAGSATFKLRVNPNCPNAKILNIFGTISHPAIIATASIFVEAPNLSGIERATFTNTKVKPGENILYSITYENKGSRSAYNLMITESLSKYIENLLAISNNGVYSPLYHQIVWNLGELKPGEIGSVTFNARLKPILDNGMIIKNDAYIEAKNIPRFEISAGTITIESAGDLSFSIKDVFPKGPVSLADVLRYEIFVLNNGNMDVSNVFVFDQLSPSLSVSRIRSKDEIIPGDNTLDLDDIDGWNSLKADGIIEIRTNYGTYRSQPINTLNYPTIKSLMNEINNDKKAQAKISYENDRFTISCDGYIIGLSGSFFEAIKIKPCEYCTGSYTSGIIVWEIGVLKVGESKTVSFSAQVIGEGTITNYATITSKDGLATTNLITIMVEKDPPILIGRPIEDTDFDNLDDDYDMDGNYRIIFPVEAEPCGIIEYEIQERQGTLSWSTIGTSTGNLYNISGRTKGLTYSYRTRARNNVGFGNWTSSSDGIKVVDGGGVVSPSQDSSIVSGGITIIIPKGTFYETITFTILQKNINIKFASPPLNSILCSYELLAIPQEYNEAGTQPLKPITLILPYPDPDSSNETDDLSYRIYKLIDDQWIIVEGEQVLNPSLNTIQCSLNSLSIYGVGSPIGLSLEDITIKPNPWKSSKHKGKKIVFEGLNGRVTISIFNMGGELVFKKEVNALWEWDLLNNKGDKVSSGVYFAIIDDGKEKIIRRFAIIK
ncbi:MAG: T9SS type A sorting domain-containing protein, partial [bacterium]